MYIQNRYISLLRVNFIILIFTTNNLRTMKKLSIRLFDKLIAGILFSSFFLISCEPDEPTPTPAYGVVPMYGVPTATVQTTTTPSQTLVQHEKTSPKTVR